MKRKTIAILLISTLCISALAGCGKKKDLEKVATITETEPEEAESYTDSEFSSAESVIGSESTSSETAAASQTVSAHSAETSNSQNQTAANETKQEEQKNETAEPKVEANHAAAEQKSDVKETPSHEVINKNQDDPDGATAETPKTQTKSNVSFSGTEVSGKGIVFKTTGGSLDNGCSVYFSCENNTDEELVFTAENVKVDGKEVNPENAPWNADLRGGKSLPSAMTFNANVLRNAGIEKPNKITFDLAVYDPESDDDDLLDQSVTININ